MVFDARCREHRRSLGDILVPRLTCVQLGSLLSYGLAKIQSDVLKPFQVGLTCPLVHIFLC